MGPIFLCNWHFIREIVKQKHTRMVFEHCVLWKLYFLLLHVSKKYNSICMGRKILQYIMWYFTGQQKYGVLQSANGAMRRNVVLITGAEIPLSIHFMIFTFPNWIAKTFFRSIMIFSVSLSVEICFCLRTEQLFKHLMVADHTYQFYAIFRL